MTDAYRDAGVDLEAQDKALARVKKLVASTATPGVMSELGSFGGIFRPDFATMEEPLLVSSADGVGTKLVVARLVGDYSTIGQDLVNHCVNDILVQGAVPLFFLDYVAAGKLEPKVIVEVVDGVAKACRDNGCALLGGETAEMPGFYPAGDVDVVGFVVGAVDRRHLLDGSRVAPGDMLIGLESSGLHTNGYSLARKIVFDKLGLSVGDPLPGVPGKRNKVGELLLAPHRTYLPCLRGLLEHPGLHAMAHITGGGLTDNLPRILPPKCHAFIRIGAWEIPPLFTALQEHGGVDDEEMLRVFNMGVGMVLVVAPDAAGEVFRHLREAGQKAFPIGTVQEGGSGVGYDFATELIGS
ncbi:MAG: phosphoribosylformylglycinamidine cyclo-ligase [Acidobacteriota bacterium]